MINIRDLLGPRALSNLCEVVALRVSKLDAEYRILIKEFMEETDANGETEKSKRLFFSLTAIQQEIKEIHQKVRIGNAEN